MSSTSPIADKPSTHVHLNQPGRTQWEGFATGTTAAISGGVTTLIDMPLNSIPPTTTVNNLKEKQSAALDTGISCDVGFWGGIIPGNQDDLVPLLKAGVRGFKCFLIESGVDEFPCVQEEDLDKACKALEKYDGPTPLVMFHAELDEHAHEHKNGDANGHANGKKESNPEAYETFLDSRPESLETAALSLILKLCARYPSLRFHIVHLSAGSALPALREARAKGIKNLTVETCFHYLTLSSEDISDNATQFKCCPPIRTEANRQLLLDAVVNGEIDYVVSDHSPCTPELKKGDFMSAWGGVSGLGLGLPLLWSEKKVRQLGLVKVVDLLSGAQAKQVRLGNKGAIEVGRDADFAIFDPERKVEITKDGLLFRNKMSPYVGKTLDGRIEKTYLGGKLAFDADKGVTQKDGKLQTDAGKK